MTRFANTSCSAFMMAKMNAPLPLSVITEMQQVPSEIASTQMADKYGARTMAALRENQQRRQRRQQELCTVFLCKFTRNCNRLVARSGKRSKGTKGDRARPSTRRWMIEWTRNGKGRRGKRTIVTLLAAPEDIGFSAAIC